MSEDGRVNAVRSTLIVMLEGLREAREALAMCVSVDRSWSDAFTPEQAERVRVALDEFEHALVAAWTDLKLDPNDHSVARDLEVFASFVDSWLHDLQPVALSRTHGRHASGVTDEQLRKHVGAIENANHELRVALRAPRRPGLK